MRKTLFLLPILVLMAAFGCKKKTESVQFMFVHAMPDAPSVDVYAQGDIVASGVVYSGNSGYVTVTREEGEKYFIEIKSTSSGQVLLSGNNPAWSKDSRNAMYSYGLQSNASLGRELISDNYSTPASGKASVRFIHLAYDVAALDFLAGNSVVHANKEYLGSNALNGFTGFSEVDAGTYDLKINLAGTIVTVAQSPGYTLQNGKSYTVFAKGMSGGSGSQAVGLGVVMHQ